MWEEKKATFPMYNAILHGGPCMSNELFYVFIVPGPILRHLGEFQISPKILSFMGRDYARIKCN